MGRFRSGLYRASAKVRKVLPTVIVTAAVIVILGVGVRQGAERRGTFVYKDHLDDTAVTVDGEKLTFRDLAFYVVYEENQVQKSAYVYDQARPQNYWNSHINGVFITFEARDAAMNMAVHDRIMLRMAQSEGTVLSSDEKEQMENRRADFYEDLYDDQKERLPVSYSVLDKAIEDIAVAEKYQLRLAEENDDTFASYGYEGKAYRRLKKSHSVEVNEKLWSRVSMGRVTLNNAADYSAAKGTQNYYKGTD